MIRFFLLALGFLVAAYGTAFGAHEYSISCAVALFSIALTVLFLFVDERNVELIKTSEEPLKAAQHKLAVLSGISTMVMIHTSDHRGPWIYRYSVTIRTLFAISLAISTVALVYSWKRVGS